MAHENGSGSEVEDRSELAVRDELRAELDSAVERLVAAAANVSDDVLVDDSWAVRDVVGHVAFWHESLACSVDDLVHARRPTSHQREGERPVSSRLIEASSRSIGCRHAWRDGTLCR